MWGTRPPAGGELDACQAAFLGEIKRTRKGEMSHGIGE
jgi:hypothetical protein